MDEDEVRFWIYGPNDEDTMSLKEKLKDFYYYEVRDRFRDIKADIRLYTYGRYNKIEIPSLERGQYWEIDTRMLHGMFDLLVEYVEEQCAWMWNVTRDEYRKGSWVLKKRLKNLSDEEKRDYGIKWLQFQNDYQVNEVKASRPTWAEEAITLYRWWTEDRPRRPDPYEYWKYEKEPGREVVRDGVTFYKWGSITNLSWYPEWEHDPRTDPFEWDPIDVEEAYYEEDNEMLKRLIDIRNGLWT